MLKKLLFFELRYYRKQMVFWLAVLYAAFAGAIIITNTPYIVFNQNSPFSLIDAMLKFSAMATVFSTGFLGASALLRDSENNIESIIFSTPIDKFQYLSVRFLGLFLSVLSIHLVFVFTMMISTTTMDAERAGAFYLFDYIYGIVVIIMPNVLLASAIIFGTAMLKRKLIPIYIVTLLVFILYVLASMLGNSPLMAMSTPFVAEGGGISSLLDPFAVIPFFEQTAFWSIEDKNTLLPELKGSLLYNRLIWLSIAISAFAYTYNRFQFKVRSTKESKKIAASTENLPSSNTLLLTAKTHSHLFHFKVFISKVKIEYITIIKGLSFLVVAILIVGFLFITLYEQITRGPIDQTSYYPLTELILELLQDPLSKVGLFIAIFYAVELYWNERSNKMEMVIDATPAKNSLFFLGKFVSLTAVCFSIILVAILTAILFQFSHGYFNIKPLLYLRLFYYTGLLLMLVGGLTLVLQRFAKNKAIGLGLGVSIVFYPQVFGYLEIAYPTTIFAYSPSFIFSDMASLAYHAEAYAYVSLYWAAFLGLLSVLAIKFWKRGNSTRPQTLSKTSKSVAFVFLLLFLGSGSYLYQHYHVLNPRSTQEERIAYRAYYEKTYSKFSDLAQPTITSIDVNVDIFPDERRYHAAGRFVFQNKTDAPIERVMISMQKVNTLKYSIDIQDAALESKNEVDQVMWYKLNTPLAAMDSSELAFSIDITRSAFSRLDGENYVTAGGSYFELEDYLPFFGYLSTQELNDPKNRKAQGLPELRYTPPEEADNLYSDDWMIVSTNITTSADQTAVTVGELIDQGQKNGRNYFHYKTDQKIERVFPITSAHFSVKKKTHNGVEMQIFHSPNHNKDNDQFFNALESGMDYFNTNFVPYTFKSFKIVELPYFSSEQSFGAAFPGMYGGVENRFFNLNNEGYERNQSLRGVIHEFSHQYWGMYITPQAIGGYSMLTEVLAKYSELVLQEKLYGKYSNNKELEQAIGIYLRNRTRITETEKPLYSIGSQPMIYYAKGLHSMTALRELLGEEQINLALRRFLSKYRHPQYPTSLDLLNEFYAVADSNQFAIIDDLFKRVVFHDFKLDSATVQKENDLFLVDVNVQAIKTVLDETTNTEFKETINDSIEIALYSGLPDVENKNMITIKKFYLNKENSSVQFLSDQKPAYIKIDPNMYRIDRNEANNILKL
jgi:ABC-type transport system involved in multi-copper enzyme maturation permease subunit